MGPVVGLLVGLPSAGCTVQEVDPSALPQHQAKAPEDPVAASARAPKDRVAMIDREALAKRRAEPLEQAPGRERPPTQDADETQLELAPAPAGTRRGTPPHGPTLVLEMGRAALETKAGEAVWSAPLQRGVPNRDMDIDGLVKAYAVGRSTGLLRVRADKRIRAAAIMPLLVRLMDSGVQQVAFDVGDPADPKSITFALPSAKRDATHRLQLGYSVAIKNVWMHAWGNGEEPYGGSPVDIGEGHCMLPGHASPSKLAVDVMHTKLCREVGGFVAHFRMQPLVRLEAMLALAGLDERPDECFEPPVLHTQLLPVALPDCGGGLDFDALARTYAKAPRKKPRKKPREK